MIPTRERMDELWREMQAWPLGPRMTFVAQLAHACMDDDGSTLIDAGMFDPVAARDIYVVGGCGPGAAALRRAAASLLPGPGVGRTVKAGDQPTPFSGDVPSRSVDGDGI